MNEKLTNLLIFAAGAIVGSAVTWALLKTKYEQMANDDVEEVRELYLKKLNDLDKSEEEEGEPNPEQEKKAVNTKAMEYADKLNSLGYVKEKKEGDVDSVKDDMPYVISPEEFGELDGYETNSLTLYADNVLTDDAGIVIDNVDEVVGTDSLNHFGEYEDDSVFVRNDRHECDYEILLDTRRFSDIHR